jgi:hypothetical protein
LSFDPDTLDHQNGKSATASMAQTDWRFIQRCFRNALPLCTTFANAGRVCYAGFAALRALQRGSGLLLRWLSGIARPAAQPGFDRIAA